jgi:hypothetical protein
MSTFNETMPIPPGGEVSHSPLSWSSVIAGAFAAASVTFLITVLGSGIGLSFASPYVPGPSAASLTLAAAIWLVMAMAFGGATGGYVAGRLRSPAHDGMIGETVFRDAAQGFMVWAILTVVTTACVLGAAYFATVATTQSAMSGASTTLANMNSETPSNGVNYFVDMMFHPNGGASTAQSQSRSGTVGMAPNDSNSNISENRTEIARIMLRGVARGGLDDNDRGYLAQIVSARTGLPPDEAQRRVATVENQARDSIKDTADKTAKTGAFFAFWTFMALLFGGAAATLGGMLGGQLRDAEGRLA